MMLSKNFSAKELSCPCCNRPPDPLFVKRLQSMRDIYGKPMKINSATRCLNHNLKVKGSKHSMHMRGRAADIALSTGKERNELLRAALAAGFTGLGLAKNFLHVDDRGEEEATSWFYK